MQDTTTIRTEVYVDRGPVWDSVRVLLTESTLSNHILTAAEPGRAVVRVFHIPGDVPYEMWGSGTQALWRLLCSMAYSRDTVSLYEVVSRLDASNRLAVVSAVTELCA